MSRYVRQLITSSVVILLILAACWGIKNEQDRTERIYNSRVLRLIHLVRDEILLQESNQRNILDEKVNPGAIFARAEIVFSNRETFLLTETTLKELKLENIMIRSLNNEIEIVAPGINRRFEDGHGDDLVLRFSTRNRIRENEP
jgi:hypothetical protein